MSGYPGNYGYGQPQYAQVTGNPGMAAPAAAYAPPPNPMPGYGYGQNAAPAYPQQPGYPGGQLNMGAPMGGYGAPQQYNQPPAGYPPLQNYPPPTGYPPQQGYPAPYGAPAPAPGAYAYGAPMASAYPAAPVAYGAPMAMAAAPVMAAPVGVAVAAPMAAPAMPVIPVGAVMNYCFQLKGAHLDRKDLFSKSDPFLVFMASKHPNGYTNRNAAKMDRKSTKHNKKFGVHSNNWAMIHRTETIHNCQHPTWAPFVLNLYSLCAGNFDTVFKIECWDNDSHSNHDFIGSAVCTMRDLTVNREVRLINKRRIGIYNGAGNIEVLKCAPA